MADPTASADAPVTTRRRARGNAVQGGRSQLDKQKRRWAFIFIAPGLILFGLFVIYPVASTVWSSFFSIRPMGAATEQIFVGFDWFEFALFKDKTFQNAVKNTLMWATWSVFVDIGLGFLLAYVIHTRIRGWKFFRTAWFVPILLSPVLIGLVWRAMLRYDGGVVNGILSSVGLDGLIHNWLGEPSAIVWLFIITTWATVGFYMVLILAALEDMPPELIDAAEVDGANRRQQIRHVILPLLRPVIVSLTILTFVFKMRIFDLVWVTTQGGPYGSTETVVTWIVRRAFYWQGAFDLGYPAAMSTIWLVVMAIGIYVIRRIMRGGRDVEQY